METNKQKWNRFSFSLWTFHIDMFSYLWVTTEIFLLSADKRMVTITSALLNTVINFPYFRHVSYIKQNVFALVEQVLPPNLSS